MQKHLKVYKSRLDKIGALVVREVRCNNTGMIIYSLNQPQFCHLCTQNQLD